MESGVLIFVLGVSGSGKTTIIAELLSLFPERFVFVPSYTTRAPRPWELPGQRYHFVTKDEFQHAIDSGEFLERAVVHKDNFYGTKLKDVKDHLDHWKFVIKESDMHGLEKLKIENLQLPYCSLFLWLDDDMIRERIAHRGAPMSDEELEHRLESARNEREKALELCDLSVDGAPWVPVVVAEVLEWLERIMRERFGVDFTHKNH